MKLETAKLKATSAHVNREGNGENQSPTKKFPFFARANEKAKLERSTASVVTRITEQVGSETNGTKLCLAQRCPDTSVIQ